MSQRKDTRAEFYERLERGEFDLRSGVRAMRKSIGLTQQEYARLVDVAPRVLIDFERGVGNPTVASIEKLLKPFGLELTLRRKPRS